MKSITFIAITLLSGAISGTLLTIMNLGIVEPYIDEAINIENQNAIAQGEVINPQEFNDYRLWQKSGEIASWHNLGNLIGSLYLEWYLR